ncbi:MAG: tetratricopeptide repeat protein [Desulfobacteraceae bacterium]|jgi:hypothetical protein|nr:tetratricopeptide repeat protein [Desulfobacteraceae bacterium]
MKIVKSFKIRRMIYIAFIVFFSFPHLAFCADCSPFADNVEELQSRAEAGEAKAQLMVGKFYYYGFCFERDYREAVKWFQVAADQGNPSAQFLLGEAYEKGKGLERNYTQAAKWYERAAFKGENLAIHYLSNLYAHGLGVRKNLIIAYAWNKLVEAQGWNMVKRLKAELETNMNQDQKDRAQILSIALKKKIRKPLP